MVSLKILTEKEMKIINKKLSDQELSQVEANRLSRSIRPKLKEISKIDAVNLLKKLEYNQKAISIQKKIKEVIKNNLNDVDSIALFGSAVFNGYQDYNDIDILVVTRKKLYNNEKERWKKIKELKELLKKEKIIADIQILSKKALEYNSARNPNLIYQLKDHKIIYGRLKIPKKIEIYNADLHMKLDWSDIYDPRPNGEEIYRALRNTILVRLLLNGIIDNHKLKESLNEELGKNLIERLRTNNESKLDRKIALAYLKDLVLKTREQIKGELWEKREL